MKKLNIVVSDGQGGRLGAMLCEKIKEAYPDCVLTAVGTNSIATSAMLRSGADRGATGEYPLSVALDSADYLLGPVGIAVPASLTGEVTPKMAESVGRSRAHKILVPGEKCLIHIAGDDRRTMAEYVSLAIKRLSELESERI